MSNSVHISFNDEPPGCIPGKEIEQFILEVLNKLKCKNWDISVLFCSDAYIKNLNKQYRNIDCPTDVLSFEQGETYIDEDGSNRFNSGDIVISLDSLKFNAQEFEVGLNEELKRLLIHGILHLKGMDHSDNSPDQEMLRFQEALVRQYENVIIYRE